MTRCGKTVPGTGEAAETTSPAAGRKPNSAALGAGVALASVLAETPGVVSCSGAAARRRPRLASACMFWALPEMSEPDA